MKLKIKTQCKECGKMFEDSMEFTSHLSGEHDMNAREYYDKYLRDESTGKCLNCGSTDIKWRNIVVGYDRFCSAKCSRQFQEKNATGATIKCPICQAEVTGANNNRASQAFTKHLKDIHELTPQEYYDEYLKRDDEGICAECGKPTPFLKISVGYQKFCCKSCCVTFTQRLKRQQYEDAKDIKDEKKLREEAKAKEQEDWQEEMKRRLSEFEGDRYSLTYTDFAFERTFSPQIDFYEALTCGME